MNYLKFSKRFENKVLNSFAQIFSPFLSTYDSLHKVKNKRNLCTSGLMYCVLLCYKWFFTVPDIHKRVVYSTADILEIKFYEKLSFFFQIFKQINKQSTIKQSFVEFFITLRICQQDHLQYFTMIYTWKSNRNRHLLLFI